jgi:iron complex transport system permease protein
VTLLAPAPATVAPRARGRRRTTVVTVSLVVLLVVASVASVLVGARMVSPTALWGSSGVEHAIASARVPRTLIDLAVGAALGLAGACMQGMTRNPLADPGILGVNAGASFAMVLAMAGLGVSALSGYVWFAFAGAALAMVLVHAIASFGRDGATPAKLAIAGAAVTAALASWTSGVLLTSRQTFESFRFWQVGTTGGRDLDVLVTVLPFLAAGAVVALLSARRLNALALGDDLARGLGRRTAVDLLAGAATALAGPIGFVGLVAPHGVRALVGADYHRVLPLSAGFGALLTTAADSVGRIVLPPTEVQVGIMAAVVGVPVFLWLIRRGRESAL